MTCLPTTDFFIHFRSSFSSDIFAPPFAVAVQIHISSYTIVKTQEIPKKHLFEFLTTQFCSNFLFSVVILAVFSSICFVLDIVNLTFAYFLITFICASFSLRLPSNILFMHFALAFWMRLVAFFGPGC